MNEKDIIGLYRKQVEGRKETPPESCWDEINTRLDLEEAWDGISSELDRIMPVEKEKTEKKVLFIRILAVAASVALVTVLLVPGLRHFRSSSPEIVQLQGDSLQQQRDLPGDRDVTSSIDIAPESDLVPLITDSTAVLQSAVPKYAFTGEDVENIQHAVINTDYFQNGNSGRIRYILSPLVPLSGAIDTEKPFSNAAEISEPLLLAGTEANSEGPVSGNRGKFSAGLSLSGKNTWMLSEETFNGLNKHNLNTTKINFLNDLGLTLRYSADEKWSFEGSAFLSSKNEQSYRQYLNGVYSDKSYVLRYSSLEVTAVRDISRPGFAKPSVTLTAGAYVSYLHSAYKILNSDEFNVSDQYKPLDYGFIVGLGVEITAFGNFVLIPGLRFRYGLPNIFSGRENFPGSLNITRNATVEFRINIMMPFKKM